MLVSTRLYDSALDLNFAAAAQIFLRELAKELSMIITLQDSHSTVPGMKTPIVSFLAESGTTINYNQMTQFNAQLNIYYSPCKLIPNPLPLQY